MSSFTSVYTPPSHPSIPPLYPSPCLSTFAAAFPPSFPLSHPIHSAQRPPPLCPPNSLFLFDLPSLQGWLLPKRAEQRGTWLCLCHSHFQCHKFQFPIFLLFFFLFFNTPPPSLFSYGVPIMGICQFCFSLSFPLIHSDALSPNTYWLLSSLMSSPDFCHTECNFLPAASVMRSKWKIINILFQKKWSCVSYFKYCYFPSLYSPAIEMLPLTSNTSEKCRWSHFFLLVHTHTLPSDECTCVHAYVFVKALENLKGIQKDICSLSLQKVFNLETLTGADEAAVIAVVSEKT